MAAMAWMRTKLDPGWEKWVEEWKAEQNRLRERLVVEPLKEVPRFVAGADAAFSADKTRVLAAAVVYDREEQRIVEVRHATGRAEVPYVPGFLSFREGPTVLGAVRKLEHPWGVICFDGQGYAHPRRCGLAAHMSITLGARGIGVAKSRLIGTYEDLPEKAGSHVPLMDKGEQVGVVLRTKDRTNPLFVSVGNRVDLASAVRVVMACVTKYRIPEPTRQADIEVAKRKASLGGTE